MSDIDSKTNLAGDSIGRISNHPRFRQTLQAQQRARLNPVGGLQNRLPFQLFQQNSGDNVPYSTQSTIGIQTKTKLSQAYFSRSNIDYLQEAIRYEVYQQTNGKCNISKQSETELKIIMRSLFFQYSRNLNRDIKTQVMELDRLVIQECVPKIISEIRMRQAYLKRASEQDHSHQLSRPINTNNAGRRQRTSEASKTFL